MDVAVVGFGPAALYVAGKLAAEGYDVTVLGRPFEVFPEFVTAEAVDEFQIKDFVLEEINRIAVFSKKFRLAEKDVKGAVIDSQSLVNEMKLTASKYGADILANSQVAFSKSKKKLRVTWLGRSISASPDAVVMEASEGTPVPVIEASRVPVNKDTLEFYQKNSMWVLPAGRTVLIEGSTDLSWHKFINAAILRTAQIHLPPRRALIEGSLLRVGRAAGQASGPGWIVEEGLYAGKLLFECLLDYLEGDDGALRVYEKMPQKSSLTAVLNGSASKNI